MVDELDADVVAAVDADVEEDEVEVPSCVWERRVKRSTVLRHNILASRTWDIPNVQLETSASFAKFNQLHITFRLSPGEPSIQLVDRSEEHLDVQDELFRHPDRFEVRPIRNVLEHIRNTRRTRLLER